MQESYCNAEGPPHIAQEYLRSDEKRMIEMIAEGVGAGVIARRLGLPEIEVSGFLNRIFAKLAKSGRLELLSPKVGNRSRVQ